MSGGDRFNELFPDRAEQVAAIRREAGQDVADWAIENNMVEFVTNQLTRGANPTVHANRRLIPHLNPDLFGDRNQVFADNMMGDIERDGRDRRDRAIIRLLRNPPTQANRNRNIRKRHRRQQ